MPSLAECIADEGRLHLTLPTNAVNNVKASAAKVKKATRTLVQKEAAAAKTEPVAQLVDKLAGAGATVWAQRSPARRVSSKRSQVSQVGANVA